MQLALRRIRTRTPLVEASRAWGVAVWTAAGLSMLAGWAHMAYMSSHWREWWAYGAFFLAAGLGQAAYAAVLLRWPRPWVAFGGIVANIAIVALYVDTRTIGVPAGPHVNTIEHAAAGDLLTTFDEVILIGVLLALVGATARRWVLNLLLVAALALWVARLTGNIS